MPPNFVSICTFGDEATNEPDCTKKPFGVIGIATMSPQSVVPKSTSPMPPCAVKVFRKKLSPPNIRFRPAIMPPDCVCIVTLVLIPIIAPLSASTDSPGPRLTRASAWEGRYPMSICIVPSFSPGAAG